MIQGPKDFLRVGDHNAWCDRCGMKFKASELRKEWQGFMVCSTCWEPRHEQDFLKSVPERPAPPWSRPRNDGPSTGIPSYPVGTPASTTDGAGTTYFVAYEKADGSKL